MRPLFRFTIAFGIFLLWASNAAALSIVAQDPHLGRYQNLTSDPLRIVFDQRLDRASVHVASVFVTYADDPESEVEVDYSFATTNLTDDTLVLTPLTENNRWPFAQRLTLHLTADVQSNGGDPFSGVYPFGEVFVANIPTDMDILQEWDPIDPFDFVDAFANANVLVGYDPVDPESTDPDRPDLIPGMGATEAWKLTAGRPDVIIAVVDDGIERYDYPDLEENYFLNQGELPAPTINGTACAPDPYDCNGDGRFNVRDYDDDPTFAGLGRAVTIPDLFDAFENQQDDDGNGLPDDISGWDFLRHTNRALGVADFPEGGHGEDRSRDAAGIAENDSGDKPGYCPFCTILPVRVSSSVMPEINLLAAGLAYSYDMGASVAVFASESLNASDDVNQELTEFAEGGMTLIGVASDEDSYHHAYPGSFDDVISVKAIFPIPAIDFLGFFPMELFAFTETYCTMWGEHVHLAASSGACSSEAAGNVAGLSGLLHSRARDLGITLSGNEVKQLLTMSADDIYEKCMTWTGGGCRPGWDAHFGYGRPNAKAALAMLGDPDTGAPTRIPPEVKFRAPAWFTLIDPLAAPKVEAAGYIYARGQSFDWELQIAAGKEPADDDFTTVATGDGAAAIDGVLAQVDVSKIYTAQYFSRPPEESFDFTVTLRLVAAYTVSGYGEVRGEDRRTIALHRDADEDYGLLPGFPLDLGASGRSAIALYDLDGDADGRLELVITTSGPQSVTALKLTEDGYRVLDGFPLDVMAYNDLDNAADATLSHPAVADLFGDGEPYIVVTTMGGAVLVFDRHGASEGRADPLLDGFPVYAAAPDNSSPETFGHGRAFLGSPVLADLDLDGILEIIAASYDGYIYAWKPVDADQDGAADALPGFPVFCKSAAGNVPNNKVCNSELEDYNPQIITTPAVGIFDPEAADEDLSRHPAIFVGTSEACEDGLADMTGTRFYAIYHDGNDNPSGSPFLPDFPVKMFGPLADALPLPPVTIGITSNPALARYDGKTFIGVGSAIWFPQIIEYDSGNLNVRTFLSAPGFNALAHGSFGSLTGDDRLHYVLPISGILDQIDDWISLLKPYLVAWSLDDLTTAVFREEQHDSNWYTNPAIADISGDGLAEAICGTGGFTVDAIAADATQPPTWPKFTNQWAASGPTVGDTDGDGLLEVYQTTLEGSLYGWRTLGETCDAGGGGAAAEWWTSGHDERNTGAYGVDTLPPAVAFDLAVTETADGLRLSFTAPGDDWRCGTPVAYDIRYATAAEALSGPESFYAAEKLPAGIVPTPAPGGQQVEFDVPVSSSEVWFAMQSVDDSDNHSLISKPAAVGAGDDDDNDDDTSPNGADDDDTTGDDDGSPGDDDAEPDDDDDNDDDSCGC